MGFFASGSGKVKTKGPNIELLHKLECRGCPLNLSRTKSPKMKPSGSSKPLVYMLGPMPDVDDDKNDDHFSGEAGKLIRNNIPAKWNEYIRWNSVIRTYPGKDILEPSFVQIEACRPSIERDIERTKPTAVFGFGPVPLHWAIEQNNISGWRGRKVPIKVGSHSTWYYSLTHPQDILDRHDYPEEHERMLLLDLEKALDEVEHEHLPAPIVHTRAMAETGVEIADGSVEGDLNKVLKFIKWCCTQDIVGMDYETQNLRPYNNDSRILSVALGTPDKALAIALWHPGAKWSEADLEEIVKAFEDFLGHPKPLKAVHNLAFEMEWTAVFFGKKYLRNSKWADSIQAAYLLNEVRNMLKLEILCIEAFGINIKALSNVDVGALQREPVREVLRYNGIDAKYHCLLFINLFARLKKEGLVDIYNRHVRRVPTVVLTQIKGVPVDQATTKRFMVEYGDKLKVIEDKLKLLPEVIKFKDLVHVPFSPGANQNVLYVLQKIMKEKVNSTGEEVLSKIDHVFCTLMLEWRGLSKLKTTYIDPLALGGNYIYDDDLMHPSLNTVFTETGRLSSDSPNEQNFPKRKDKKIRQQIRVGDKYVIVAFDYGQIEARVIAMASKDKAFVKSMWDKHDVHMDWAEKIADLYPQRIGGKKFRKDEKVMKALRADVKNEWTFPLFFGAGIPKVSRILRVPPEILTPLYDEFWDVFKGVRQYQKDMLEMYQQNGYVSCLTGRRRRGPLTTNQVYNSPIQGTMCDITVDSMDRLSEKEVWTLQPMMQIHDDLTFKFPVKKVDEYAEIVINEMLSVTTHFDFINVPITVEMLCGQNWGEMSECGTFSSDGWFK